MLEHELSWEAAVFGDAQGLQGGFGSCLKRNSASKDFGFRNGRKGWFERSG
jgi:hypothetical protein